VSRVYFGQKLHEFSSENNKNIKNGSKMWQVGGANLGESEVRKE